MDASFNIDNSILYTFRYDYLDKSWCDIHLSWFIKQNCKKYSLFYEIADITGKPHIQGVIIPNKSDSQFRRDLKSSFKGFFDKSNYSVAPVKKSDNYLAYICKEKTVFINNMLSESQIENLHKSYWELNKKVVASEKKKQKQQSWSQELTKELEQKYPDHIWLYNGPITKLIGDEVLEKLGQTSKKISSHIYRDLVLGQLNALNPNSGLKHKFHLDAFPEFHNGANYY